MSSQHPIGTASARSYAAAHSAHYARNELLEALQAYGDVIEQHPNAPEAEYSRSQMRNIVRQVVPAPELLACQLELARRHLQRSEDEPLAAVPPKS